MSWLKRITGIQELINEQRQTNNLLRGILTQIVDLNTPKPEERSLALFSLLYFVVTRNFF